MTGAYRAGQIGPMDRPEQELRETLLRKLPGFAGLPAPVIGRLSAMLERSQHAAGAVLVREGEAGDRLYLLAAGGAEVTSTTDGGPVPLAALGPGEWFGEIALLAADSRRTATVTAQSDVVLYALPRQAFDAALAAEPGLRKQWQSAADALLRAKFLKEASPFAQLPPEAARALAARLETRTVAGGEVICRVGESGDRCYLVRRGEVAVLLDAAGSEPRELARLGPGALFGEMALLSDAPRSATIRATETCELWSLGRADLLAAMAAARGVGLRVVELFRFRDRPRQVPGIVAFERRLADGQSVFVLKNPERRTYYRLSEEGMLVWRALDGEHSLRDLILEYFRVHKRFAPGVIAGLLEGLAAAGMIETHALTPEATAGLIRLSRWQRVAFAAARLASWQASLTGCDPWFERAYRGGVRLLFAPAALVAMAIAAAAGLAAFAYGAIGGRLVLAPPSAGGAWFLLFLIAANVVAIVLHEAGHAFATKHYGREVDRVGVGWYWVGPIAFVDTSDMWLMGAGPRIAVSLAGVFVNAICAGLASLAALIFADGAWAALLWQFALVSYALILLNLNPLLEYDGYYILIDWLDRPNLRRQSLTWLLNGLPAALCRRAALAGHGIELWFGLAALAYLAAAAVLAGSAMAALLAPLLPPLAAAAAAWVPALLLALMAAGELAGAARRGLPK